MPNWVWNNLTIKTEDKHYILNDKEEVDFNVLLPMPEDLKRTISGGVIKDCIAYFVLVTQGKEHFVDTSWFKDREMFLKFSKDMAQAQMLDMLKKRIGNNPEMYNDEKYDEEHGHTIMEIGEHYYNLLEQYGCYDWYQWSNHYWGCKWNASDTNTYNNGDGTTTISFDTPWCYPDGWLDALADKIPFHLAWEEEQGFRGIIISKGEGCIFDEPLEDLDWEEDEDGDYRQIDHQFGNDYDWTKHMIDEAF